MSALWIPATDYSCNRLLKARGVSDEDLDKLTVPELEEIALKLARLYGERLREDRVKTEQTCLDCKRFITDPYGLDVLHDCKYCNKRICSSCATGSIGIDCCEECWSAAESCKIRKGSTIDPRLTDAMFKKISDENPLHPILPPRDFSS